MGFRGEERPSSDPFFYCVQYLTVCLKTRVLSGEAYNFVLVSTLISVLVSNP